MDIIIKRGNYDDALKANDLLTKLICDEKKYDENINEACVVKSLYERFFNQDDVCLLVAKDKEKVVGYLYGFVQNSGDSIINKVCNLDAIYVEEKYRNKKIATKLINEFKIWVKENNAKYIELKVCNKNTKAINLYKKFGFIDCKTIMTNKLGE